jgi:hypothetical protein
MGGIGSGREGNRIAVEACLSLDINNLRRQGLLGSGVHARWSWTHDGEEVASLEMLVGFGVLHLEGVDHRYDARKIDHAVSTTYTSCNYGGSRPWFRCPNCSRRAGKLYMPLGGRHFLCRRCYDLAYHSQWEEPWWRVRRRASKLWQRLGGDPDDDLIPPRPRGMHCRTYERLIAEAERAEGLAGASIAASMSKRFGRRLE